MTISIQNVDEADLPIFTKQLAASKFAQSINRLLWKNWPDSDLQNEQTGNSVRGSFNGKSAILKKAVDVRSGDILGFIIYVRRQAVPPPASNAGGLQTKDVPDRFNADVIITVMGAMSEIAKVVDVVDGLEVSVLTVDSAQQRKGVGSRLMGEVFDYAKAENLPIVVRSEPASYDFFRKLGFHDMKHVELDLSRFAPPMSGYGIYRMSGMIWRP